MNDQIDYDQWDAAVRYELAELNRLLLLTEPGRERHAGLSVQIVVLAQRIGPTDRRLNAYASDPELHAYALEAARWMYDKRDEYPKPSVAWREAIEG
jgi:hypothetical protein